jgi:hypothetical protein
MSNLSVFQCSSSFSTKLRNLGIHVTSNHERDGRTSVDLCQFMKPAALETTASDGASIHASTPKKYISKILIKRRMDMIQCGCPKKPRCLKATINKVSHGPLSTETPSLGLKAHGVIGIPKANIIFLQRSWSKSCWDATSRFGYAKPNQSAWQMVQVPCAFQHK